MRVEKHSFPPMFTCIGTPISLLEFKDRAFANTRFRMNAQGGAEIKRTFDLHFLQIYSGYIYSDF